MAGCDISAVLDLYNLFEMLASRMSTTRRNTDAQELISANDRSMLPQHIAIIMDGNGRWAQKRGWPRFIGHREGAERVREIISSSSQLGIRYLTLYAFSEENWQRPAKEVSFLMNLLSSSIKRFLNELHRQNVQLRVMGNIDRLPASTRFVISEAVHKLATNTGIVVTLALSYSGKDEMLRSVRKLAVDVANGVLRPEDISEATLRTGFDQPSIPDPDLLIRTSGEIRISNFMLWQMAYAEMYFTETLWPDFGTSSLHEAIREYQRRNRRFGKIEDSPSSKIDDSSEWQDNAASMSETHA